MTTRSSPPDPGLLHPRSFARWVIAAWVVAFVLLGTACEQDASQSPSSPLASTTAAGTTAGTATTACPNIDLRTPAGERIDLNGTWATEREGVRGGIYYFRQVGSCVWFVGAFPPISDDPNLPGALGYVTVVFRGDVGSDLRIVGEWVDARDQFPDQPGASGTLELSLDVTDAGDLRLTYVGGRGQPFIEPGYREEQSWVKIAEGGAYPPSN